MEEARTARVFGLTAVADMFTCMQGSALSQRQESTALF